VVCAGAVWMGAVASAQEGERLPLGVEPGAPAGSYTLSEFERINLFNGSLSFHLPLLKVGGRGEAGFTVGLTLEKRWGVRYNRESEAIPRFSWGGVRPGYGPGTFRFFRDIQEPYWLTRASFTASDETQYELDDVLYEGEPGPRGSGRGQVFRTFDGSAITFVSDSPIVEDGAISPGAGRLLFPDGVQYRIDGGLVDSIRDRNGNVVRFAYTTPPEVLLRGPQVSEVVDSLERRVTFTYASAEAPYDTINFQGFGGASRTITVDYADLGNALIEGESLQTLVQLFPYIIWALPDQVHNPKVVSAVRLPNGRQYSLSYNAYGEIAEVVLPTGGIYRYAHDDSGALSAPERRLRERSVYAADGHHETRTLFSRPSLIAPEDQYVEVDSLDPATGALLARERHFYHGRSGSDLVPGPLSYPDWRLGKEYRTEVYGPGSPSPILLRTAEQSWQQRALRGWVQGGENVVNDPRVFQTTTTLEDGLTSAEVYAYDLYNNRTDTWEYDYGSSFPGALLRRRHTDYLTINNGVDYATTLSIHLRRLPRQEATYDGVGQLRARTTYEYDQYPGGLLNRSNLSGRASPEEHGAGYTTRGNVTGIGRWLDTTSSDLVTGRSYDIAGNVVSETNPRQLTTSFAYDDNFGSPDGQTSDHVPPPELGGLSTFAFASEARNPLQHATQTQTDYYLGRPVDGKDPNGVVTSVWFNDPLDRLTRIIQANSPGHQAVQTRKGFAYDDVTRTVTTVSDKDAFNDQKYKSDVVYDSLGREVLGRTYEGPGSQDFIAVEKGYDARGRLSAVSNPYRPSETPLWTDTTFDALGRQTVQTLPDATQVLTSYNGNAVTVTDQAGKIRKSVSDALGRVVTLTEDPVEGRVCQVVEKQRRIIRARDYAAS
jgi:YD repeat-containing protein